MKSLNQLQEDQLAIQARFADAAMIASHALARFVDLLERLEKHIVEKELERFDEKKQNRGKPSVS